MATTAYVPKRDDKLIHVLRSSDSQVLIKDARRLSSNSNRLYSFDQHQGIFRFVDNKAGIAHSPYPNTGGWANARQQYGSEAHLVEAFGFVYNLSVVRCSHYLEWIAYAIGQGTYTLPLPGRHPECEHYLAITPQGVIHHYQPSF